MDLATEALDCKPDKTDPLIGVLNLHYLPC
jgi:hypothetical protein